MKKNFIITVATFLIAAAFPALSGLADSSHADDILELALKNYNKAHYRKALYYFERIPESGLKADRLKFVQYAIGVIKDNRPYLYDLEKNESKLKVSGSGSVLADAVADKHYMFALRLMEKQFYIKIVEPHLKRAIKLKPSQVAAYIDLGNAYYSAMWYVRAVESYEKAISIDANNLYAHKMAGDASVAVGDFDKAKETYLNLLKINEKAVLGYDKSEIEKVKNIIKILPNTYKDIDKLLKDEKYDEAEVILKKRISLNQSDYIAVTALANIYLEKGDRGMALRLLNSAAKTAPDYPIAHLYLGRLHYVMRKYEDAISEFRIFKEKMGLLPKMTGDTKKIYLDCIYYLCEVYFTLERYKDARSELEAILKIDPKEQDAYYDLGVYYYKYEHNRSRAYQSFKKVVDIDSTTSTAKSAKYAIEYMRNNPDARVIPDFSFLDREYKE